MLGIILSEALTLGRLTIPWLNLRMTRKFRIESTCWAG
jgi:hypothetical protein